MKHYLLRLTEEEHYQLKNYAAELDMPIKNLIIVGTNTYYFLAKKGRLGEDEKLKQCSQEQYEEDKTENGI